MFFGEKGIDEKKSSDALDFFIKLFLGIRYIYNKLYAK